ncbi:unnamed protein product [Schistosoma mattheei]|uniref:Uncharacterized protein n=1 Tax=Schistosoma mattheei TaxID=31246 RepID=A0AA85BNE3_9TREM|nr:unnamed protein product [Schistosoma mattheei]
MLRWQTPGDLPIAHAVVFFEVFENRYDMLKTHFYQVVFNSTNIPDLKGPRSLNAVTEKTPQPNIGVFPERSTEGEKTWDWAVRVVFNGLGSCRLV